MVVLAAFVQPMLGNNRNPAESPGRAKVPSFSEQRGNNAMTSARPWAAASSASDYAFGTTQF